MNRAWCSKNVCYTDPKYGADIRVQLAGTFVAGAADPTLEAQLATASVPVLQTILSTIPMDEIAKRRPEIAGKLLEGLQRGLPGAQLAALTVDREIWNNRSVAEDFSRKAGPVLIGVGALSIVLNLVGLNLKILAWVDAWGLAVGWLLRLGVVGLGVAFWTIGKQLNRD